MQRNGIYAYIYIRAKKIFPRRQITLKTHWIRSNGLTPPPVFIAFLGLSKMSSSCPTCRPGPTGPNSSYATVWGRAWSTFKACNVSSYAQIGVMTEMLNLLKYVKLMNKLNLVHEVKTTWYHFYHLLMYLILIYFLLLQVAEFAPEVETL